MTMTTWLLLAFAIWFWFVLVNYENTRDYIKKTPLHVALAMVTTPVMIVLIGINALNQRIIKLLSLGEVDIDDY